MSKLLSQDFLSQFRGVRPSNAGSLFEVTYLGKYSRWLPDKKRRETWDEVCERVVEYNLSLYQGPASHTNLVKEAEHMYSYMFNLLSLPAGRSMRIGGTKSVEAHPESAFNCTGTVISELEDFCDVFHLTMCSCGVGFRNLQSDVDKLPILNTNFSVFHDQYLTVYPYIKVENTEVIDHGFVGSGKIYSITVGDSKLGWVDSLRQYLKILSTEFYPIEIRFNYDYVRPEKSRLHTWGGHAAGPEGLIKMFDNLTKIIKNSNGKLKPIDVLDICTYIAKNVVVGGTRRAALICLFSPDDYECRSAKRILGYFGWSDTKEPVEYDDYNDIKLDVEYTGKIKWFSNKEYEHRTMSNNSIVFDYKPSYDELKEIFKSIRHNGEPGFFNKAAASKRRPNAEVLNPCVSKDTWVMTSCGPKQVKDLIDVPFQAIVNGRSYKSFGFWKTATKNVYLLKSKEGFELKLTDDHKVLKSDGSWVEAGSLNPGDKIKISDNSSFRWSDGTGTFDQGWIVGNMIGDGCFSHSKVKSDLGCLRYWGTTKEHMSQAALISVKKSVLHRSDLGIVPNKSCNYNQIAAVGIAKLTEQFGLTWGNKVVTDSIEESSYEFHQGFLRGIFDADGSVQGSVDKGISVRLTQANRGNLVRCQRMLLRLGIKSVIYKRKESGYKMLPDSKRNPKEYFCQAMYELVISKDAIKQYALMVGFTDPEKSEKLDALINSYGKRGPYKTHFTVTFESLHLISVEDVYDCTVEDVHCFDANGIIAHNCSEIIMDSKGVCNLSTVILTSHIIDGPVPSVNYETLEQAVRLAVRVGLRQTNVTLSLPKWDFVQKRDRLIGPSKTGEMDFLDKLGIKTNSFEHTRILETMNFWANDEADRYAFEMRVPRPLLVTSTKPEGTQSLLATVSPGMHRSFAPFYLRRFKFADFDPMCKALIELGVPHEKDCTKSDSNRMVFEFPVKSDATSKAVDESFRDQFNRYLTEQKFYTDHNTSCTLYVGKDEWHEALQLTYDNWDDIIAVSFLPKDEGVYPQAPFQAISKEEYEARASRMPDLTHLADLVSKYELEESDSSMDEQEICSTGACPTT